MKKVKKKKIRWKKIQRKNGSSRTRKNAQGPKTKQIPTMKKTLGMKGCMMTMQTLVAPVVDKVKWMSMNKRRMMPFWIAITNHLLVA